MYDLNDLNLELKEVVDKIENVKTKIIFEDTLDTSNYSHINSLLSESIKKIENSRFILINNKIKQEKENV